MFKVDMSHQEMERLLSELEQWYEQAALSGAEWITAQAAGSWLRNDLGYEDEAEFEDALNSSFEEFLEAMPHIETKVDEQGRVVFKVRPEPPPSEWKPTKMTLKINSRDDIWNVCFKSQWATVEIPELEFHISQDGKRRIDSIYNHVAGAVFNLGSHVEGMGGYDNDQKAKISECIMQLNALLDMDQPWTWILRDPSGTSSFQNMDRVQVEELEG